MQMLKRIPTGQVGHEAPFFRILLTFRLFFSGKERRNPAFTIGECFYRAISPKFSTTASGRAFRQASRLVVV
jgi:hypothetical protein